MREKNTFTLLVLVTLIMASCQFPRIPEQSVVVDRYIIAEKTTFRYDPVIHIMRHHTTPARYILVIEDPTGNRYNYQANEIHFQKIQIGDSLYYNRDTGTMIYIKSFGYLK